LRDGLAVARTFHHGGADQGHGFGVIELQAACAVPPYADLIALQELVRLGFYRGNNNKLDALLAAHPDCASYVETMRTMARQFHFEIMLTQLQNELDANHAR
jgi:hypothetical protein